jgi:putative transcriptional regulator
MIFTKAYLKAGLFGVVLLVLFSTLSFAFAPAKGMYLVADEKMNDPRFKDRVILLIQHDTQGTAGLIVNKSSRLPLSDVLPETSRLNLQGKLLSYGGPVNPETLLALVKVHNNPPHPANEVLENLYVTGVGVLDRWPELSGELVDYRAFLGYTGWAAGQLDLEMQRGDWHVLPADGNSMFNPQDETFWESLIKRGQTRN